MEWDGYLFAYNGKMPALLDCAHYVEYWGEAEREIVELFYNGQDTELELTRIPSGFGGSRPFWLCPSCGGRVRYLYRARNAFVCRKCARLNYKSQQETRSGSMYYYDKGVALVEKRLDTWPRVRPDGFTFCEWVPDRPRYMHKITYNRYLCRFMRYRDRHEQRQLEELRRLLKILD